MNFKFLFYLGAFLSFIGLFWMLLPHAFHERIIGGLDEKEIGLSHTTHLIQGVVPALTGILLMIYSEKQMKIKYINPRYYKKQWSQ